MYIRRKCFNAGLSYDPWAETPYEKALNKQTEEAIGKKGDKLLEEEMAVEGFTKEEIKKGKTKVEQTIKKAEEEGVGKKALNWMKNNKKLLIVGTSVAAAAGGAGAYAHHRNKAKAKALAEASAEKAYSDTYCGAYDYYTRLFSDDEPLYTEEDMKTGNVRSALMDNLTTHIGNKELKNSLRNGDDFATARRKGIKKSAIAGALVGGGVPAAASLYLLRSNPAMAIGTAAVLGSVGAGLGAAAGVIQTDRRADRIYKASKERRGI